MIKVGIYSSESIDIQQWNNFIERIDGNIHFVYEWITFDSKMRGYKPYFCIAKNENDIVGVAYFQVNTKKVLFTKFYAVTMSGPIVEQSAKSKLIVDSITTKLECYFRQKKNVQLRWAKCRAVSNADYMDKFSGEIYEYYTYIIDLDESLDALWKNIVYTHRKQVRKAQRNGVEVRVADSIFDVVQYIEAYQPVFKAKGLNYYKKDYFLNLWKLGNFSRIYIASYEDKIVGGLIYLFYRNTVFTWNGFTTEEGKKVSPYHLLVWDGIVWAKENGFSVYDLGGTLPVKCNGASWYSSIDKFKKLWGGELEISYGKKHIYSNLYKNLSQARYKLEPLFDTYRKFIRVK